MEPIGKHAVVLGASMAGLAAARVLADVYERVEVVVAPPFTSLRSAQTVIETDRMQIGLGAQNVFWEDEGAYTGEVSAPMLAKLSVSYVIVGHSERRQHFGETDETVNKRIRAVLRHEMTPIVCVGETLDEREEDRATDVVVAQLRGALSGIDADQVGGMAIAYEPVAGKDFDRMRMPELVEPGVGLGHFGGDPRAALSRAGRIGTRGDDAFEARVRLHGPLALAQPSTEAR